MKKHIILTLCIFFTACSSHDVRSSDSVNQPEHNIVDLNNKMTRSSDSVDQLGHSIVDLNNKMTRFNDNLGLDQKTRYLGVDYLYNSLSLANEIFIEKASISSPKFVDWMITSRKVAGDNPWTRYQSTMIKGESTYEIQGNIGNAIYLGVQVYSLREGRNIALPEKNISTPNITLDAKGNFKIAVGSSITQNGIKTDPDDYMLIMREYYANGNERKAKPANYQITQLSGDFDTPFIASPTERVEKANAFFNSLVESSLDLTAQMAMGKNQSVDFNPNPKLVHALFPTVDNNYDGFYIHLNDEQAIKLTGTIPPNLAYASITYYNPYYATIDYEKNKIYLTKDEIKLNQDGSYTIYITKKNLPKVRNLITTGGYSDGVIAIRYLGQGRDEIDFDIQLINITDIPSNPL